eukprot:95145-Amorphochlora_amoeboformis.AAC.1
MRDIKGNEEKRERELQRERIGSLNLTYSDSDPSFGTKPSPNVDISGSLRGLAISNFKYLLIRYALSG